LAPSPSRCVSAFLGRLAIVAVGVDQAGALEVGGGILLATVFFFQIAFFEEQPWDRLCAA
jgi:hypothetical protein